MITICIMLMIPGVLQAQNLDNTEETLVVNYLRDANPGAEDVDWMRVEGTDRVRITFSEDGVKQYALVNQEAVEYETGYLIDEDDLPEPTDGAFTDSKYSDWDIHGIYVASTPRQGELYRFDVSSGDDNLVTLYYNELGERISITHNVNPAR